MTKAHIQTENSKQPIDTKILISQQLQTDLGWSVGVTTTIQLLQLNPKTGTQPPTNRMRYQKDAH